MPSRDPKTGKEPSGAQKRKRRYAKTDVLIATGAAGAPLPDDGDPFAPPNDDGKWAKDFENAGTPDLNNPGTDLDYVRKLQLIVLRQMATTPFPTVAQQNAWRRINENSRTVGMTSNRAQLEATVRRLKKALEEKRQDSGIVKVVHGSKVAKPKTARGQVPFGPRAAPDEGGSVTPPPEGEQPDSE